MKLPICCCAGGSRISWVFVCELREAERVETTVGLVGVTHLQHAAKLRLHSWWAANRLSGRNAHCISFQGAQYVSVTCIPFFPLTNNPNASWKVTNCFHNWSNTYVRHWERTIKPRTIGNEAYFYLLSVFFSSGRTNCGNTRVLGHIQTTHFNLDPGADKMLF